MLSTLLFELYPVIVPVAPALMFPAAEYYYSEHPPVTPSDPFSSKLKLGDFTAPAAVIVN